MKSKIIKFGVVIIMFMVFVSACDKDDDIIPQITKGDVAILASLPNPDGQSGSTYFQLIEDLTPKTYNNRRAFPFNLFDQLIMRGEDMYVLSFAGSDVIKKYSRNADKELSPSGQLIVSANSSPFDIVIKNSNKAYISMGGKSKVLIINPATMTKTGEIDIASYGVGDKNPDPSQMIIRDNKLYVALNQSVGGYYAAKNRPYSDVLIIDTETDLVEKMITEKNSGISQPTRPFDDKQMFMDEKQDIYIVCTGGFGAVPGHKCGILRIRNGESEFDNTYSLNLTDANIMGESNHLSWLPYVQYGGNGKLYAQADIPAYKSSRPNFVTDKTTIAVEIDLYAKTLRKLDLPRGNQYGSVGICKNKIAFGIAADSESGFFTYNMDTQKTSPGAVIKAAGFPSLFRHFGEKY